MLLADRTPLNHLRNWLTHPLAAQPPCCRMLPAYSGEGALRSAFFNSLKEAACISRGSAQRVMEMAAGAQVSRLALLPLTHLRAQSGSLGVVALHACLHAEHDLACVERQRRFLWWLRGPGAIALQRTWRESCTILCTLMPCRRRTSGARCSAAACRATARSWGRCSWPRRRSGVEGGRPRCRCGCLCGWTQEVSEGGMAGWLAGCLAGCRISLQQRQQQRQQQQQQPGALCRALLRCH